MYKIDGSSKQGSCCFSLYRGELVMVEILYVRDYEPETGTTESTVKIIDGAKELEGVIFHTIHRLTLTEAKEKLELCREKEK